MDDDITNEDITEYIETRQRSPSLQDKIDKLVQDDLEQRKRNYKYYDAIRKEDREKFLSPSVQKQIDIDAQALAEDFYR